MCRAFFRLSSQIRWLLKSLLMKLTCNAFRTNRWTYRSLLTYFILVSFSTVVLVHNQPNRYTKEDSADEFSVDENETIQCRFPQLSLVGEGLQFTIPKNIQPICKSWFFPVVIENHSVRQILPYLTCTAMFYLGSGDRRYRKIPVPLVHDLEIPLLSDYFTVQCENDMKANTGSKTVKFYPKLPYASIHYDANIRRRLARVKREEDDYNILVLGLDSVSRLQFERMLPRTYDYVANDLKSTILKGYNILGDGTPQQLIPMLTGLKELELPSTLHRDRNGSFVDVYPFIWKKFRELGYVTGYAEDRLEYGIWTLRLKGFDRTPTDHYLSPFYRMEATKALLYRHNTYCVANQTSFEVFLSYIDRFWSSYSENKKFFFGFFKQYTHDGYTAGSALDLSLLTFLKKFQQTEDHRKTIILLMTDHGARFSSARRTPQGKLEERLPFMSFILPPSFQKRYPTAMKNLRKNIHRLTTPFDIHSTLSSLLNMKAVNYSETPPVKQRNISLFHVIPAHRTCDDLNLEPHWCSCLQWNSVNVKNKKVIQATKSIVNYINTQLLTVKDHLCQQLQLASIHNAQIYQPNQALLKFSKSSDVDGRVPKYDDKKTDITFYQITFETKPNEAIYEATTQYSNKSSGFTTDLNYISRLNAYKSSASCIEKSDSHLRKFCDCIK